MGIVAFLDMLARILAVTIPVGGLVIFLARRWLGAKIDAHFKRQVDADIKALDHKFATELESVRSALNAGLERTKRELDDEFRKKARFSDANLSYYEAYQTGFGRVIVDIVALDGWDSWNKITPGLGDELRKQNVLKIMSALTELQAKLDPLGAYIETNYKLRVAGLYKDLIDFLAAGATDRGRLDALNTERALISVELRDELMETAR